MELLIQEYDDLASPDVLADDVIVSVVMKTIPEPMKTHFDLNTHLCETYEDLEREIHKYVGIKREWKNPYAREDNGPKPME
eukprot:4518995-Pyramimonas_sp.AAC.1